MSEEYRGEGGVRGPSSIPDVHRLLEEGLTSSDALIMIIDSELHFLYVSPAAASLLGVALEILIGRTGEEARASGQLSSHVQERARAVLGDGCVRRGVSTIDTDGRRIFLEYDTAPIFGRDGERVAVIEIWRDRTEQARYQHFLEVLNEVNNELSSGPEVSDLIPRTIDLVKGALDEDGFALAVKRGGGWMAEQSLPLTPAEAGELGLQAFKLAEEVIRTGEAIRLADVQSDERVEGSVVGRYGIRSLLIVPVRISGEVAGALFFARLKARPFTDADENLASMLATAISMAISKQLVIDELIAADRERSALNRSLVGERDLVHGIIDASPMSIALLEGPELIVTMCNRSYKQHTWAFRGDEHEGRSFLEHFDPEEGERLLALLEIVQSSRQPIYGIEHTRRTPSGTFRHVRLSLVPLSHDPLRILGVTADVTDLVEARKRIEEMAERAEQERKRLRTILDTLPVGVLVIDADGNTVESNKVREAIWGGKLPALKYPEGAKMFKGRWSDTGMPLHRNDWPLMRALRGEAVSGASIDITRFDGKQATELSSAVPLYDGSGRIIGAVSVLLDITSQRMLEHQALEAKERAEMYLDLMTNDIGGLNSVIAAGIERAREGRAAKSKKDELEIALQAVTTSTELIDTIKKIQSVEANEVFYSPVDLGMVLEDAVDSFRDVPGASIETHLVTNRLVHGSPLLKDLFINIIGNAVKHAVGPVVVTMSKSFEAGREHHKVIIEDHGPGIPDAVKSRMFLRKYRGPAKATGTGLGLYLVKRLAEEHDGKVWVEDRVPGDHTKGAKFIVMLPAVSERDTEAPRAEL